MANAPVFTVNGQDYNCKDSFAREKINTIEKEVDGSETAIEYVQNGTGFINENLDVNYSSDTTGNNSLMVINNLNAYGLAVGDWVRVKVGLNPGLLYAVGFSDQQITTTTALFEGVQFPSDSDLVQEITFVIPTGTVAMVIYNRKPSLAEPTIAKITRGVKELPKSVYNDIEYSGVTTKIQPANEFYGKTVEFSYDRMPLEPGYMSSTGEIIGTTHKHFILRADKIKSVTMKPVGDPFEGFKYLIMKSDSGSLSQAITTDITTETTFVKPEGFTGWFVFNYFIGQGYINSCKIAYEDREEIKYYQDIVEKPYSYSGKTLHFYGDSITLGYLYGGSISEHPFPETLCAALGATCSNRGVSGSGFATTETSTILAKIQSYGNLDAADVMFIAGGVNDWQEGKTESELRTALDSLCTYLGSNYNGRVVFITPINEPGRTPNVTPAISLQHVRNIITQAAIKYGYECVQGWRFPFPNANDDSSFKALVFSDNIHPNDLGYSLYAKAVQAVIG